MHQVKPQRCKYKFARGDCQEFHKRVCTAFTRRAAPSRPACPPACIARCSPSLRHCIRIPLQPPPARNRSAIAYGAKRRAGATDEHRDRARPFRCGTNLVQHRRQTGPRRFNHRIAFHGGAQRCQIVPVQRVHQLRDLARLMNHARQRHLSRQNGARLVGRHREIRRDKGDVHIRRDRQRLNGVHCDAGHQYNPPEQTRRDIIRVISADQRFPLQAEWQQFFSREGLADQLVQSQHGDYGAGGAAAQTAGKRQAFYQLYFEPAFFADVIEECARRYRGDILIGFARQLAAIALNVSDDDFRLVPEFDNGAIAQALQRQAEDIEANAQVRNSRRGEGFCSGK